MSASTLNRPGLSTVTAPAVGLRGQVARFAVIGAGCTALNLVLLAVLTTPLGAQTANVVGLLVSTLVNTAANRAWTFGVHGGGGLARHHLQALLVFVLTWAGSSGALALLSHVVAHPSTEATVLTVAVANALSTVLRFGAMRRWIFRAAD